MKTLVKVAALATGIIAMTACSWFSNDPAPVGDHAGPKIDTTIQTSVNDTSKTNNAATEKEKDASIQASN